MVKFFSALLLLFFTVSGQTAEFKVPRLSAPVVDTAGILTRSTKASLNSLLHELRKKTGTQLAILTVPSLNQVPLEQASIQVVDAWKLGDERGDRGVLLLISKKDRKVRIEVGQGHER
ncbi:unnamed protein product, partial [marine sediment metagenome]